MGVLLAVPILIWAFSFIGLLGQEKCSNGSISDADYEQILSQAGAQRWTVWPSLSNGVFWPSDAGFRGPTESFERTISDQLLSHIKDLAGSDSSANRQLASAHAVLRSMGAEYVQTLEVPDTRRDRAGYSHVHFKYFMPKVRFAPLCIFCLAWWYTTLDVIFSHELAADRYESLEINVLHAGLKYNPDKNGARNVPWGSCPEFRRRP